MTAVAMMAARRDPDEWVLAQWHDQAEPGEESGKPMLAHRYSDGRFYVTHDGHGIRQMVLYEDKTFARGRWPG